MKQTDINNHIFDKEVTCPVCKSIFKVMVVKVNSPRIASKDSDFFIRYNIVNPYFYDVWLCNSCGYTAMKGDFPKIKNFEKELILSNITTKWREKESPTILDANNAIERYKLALINATVMEKNNSTLGMILLKIAWMYRLLGDKANETQFLLNSLEALSEAYSLEDFPMYGMQRDSLSYLLGDLNKRIGNLSEALRWYSSVITSPSSSYRVKDLARDGKDEIKVLR